MKSQVGWADSLVAVGSGNIKLGTRNGNLDLIAYMQTKGILKSMRRRIGLRRVNFRFAVRAAVEFRLNLGRK